MLCGPSWIRRPSTAMLSIMALVSVTLISPVVAQAQQSKPNIVVIMTDDFGWGDMGAYGGGVMRGAPTPNLDHFAAEGMRFVNYYGQASCTAGRASFITGRIPIRTALSTVLVPGDPDHITPDTPTVAQFLKEKAGPRRCRGGVPDIRRLRRDVPHATLLRGRLRLRRPQLEPSMAQE
jgi:hypothetical protein